MQRLDQVIQISKHVTRYLYDGLAEEPYGDFQPEPTDMGEEGEYEL